MFKKRLLFEIINYIYGEFEFCKGSNRDPKATDKRSQ